VPFATIEQMAQYSKSLWPKLITSVRATATWVDDAPFRWEYLDAAWAQYSIRKGNVATYTAANVAAAKAAGIGLIVGLNIISGGDGSSGVAGPYEGAWNMTGTEVRNYGKVLIADPYVCGFHSWKYTVAYMTQSSINSALKEVEALGRTMEHKPCKVRGAAAPSHEHSGGPAQSAGPLAFGLGHGLAPESAMTRHFGMLRILFVLIAWGAGDANARQGTGQRPSPPDSNPPRVEFRATGGSITPSGLYTAGPAAGMFRVIATSGTLADTAAVRATGAPGSGSAGMAFGAFDLLPEQLAPPFSSSVLSESPDHVLRHLAQARESGAKLIVNFAGGSFRHVQGTDGTFSYALWKARVDRFLPLKNQIGEYVGDGTLLAFMLIDEPHSASSWGGEIVPHAMLEQMARYSKSLWPDLTTTVRSHATWLKGAKFRWASLDAAWAQYSARRGDVSAYVAENVAAAREAGLGLIVGMNVLDGGDGSSRQPGTYRGAYNMSPAELSAYGRVLAAHPYACSLQLWKYDPIFMERADVKSALSELAELAGRHSHGPCKVH
jgi:uncharacterized protein YfcZ (UPF0381/DUF406 family)